MIPHDVEVDVAVVGAGIAGLYAALEQTRRGLTVHGFESADDIGGTWYRNRYPGARCDIESLEYSYQFDDDLQRDWDWTERYAAQPEILRYVNHVADRFDLRRHFSLATRVERVAFGVDPDRWTLTTDTGRTCHARFVVMATGGVSAPRIPSLDGIERFAGPTTHTATWPRGGFDVEGRSVAVIGTGSSGVQCIPELARRAAHLHVFQRTPNYVLPAGNRPIDPAVVAEVRADPARFRRRNASIGAGFGAGFDRCDAPAAAFDEGERDERYRELWDDGGFAFLDAFGDLTTDAVAAATAGDFVRRQIRRIVADPAVARRLSPEHVFGCRRLCFGTGYYETFNRDDVTLVDVGTAPIVELTATGVRTAREHVDVEAIVFATGFADQGAALRQIEIVGPAGGTLADAWAERPRTYLGLLVAGFPNLFMVNAPGSPSITTNMIANAEHSIDWIADCIEHVLAVGADRVEARPDAERGWTERVDASAAGGLYHRCSSRYVGVTPNGRPFAYPYMGVPDYLDRLARVAAAGYPGLALSPRPVVPVDARPDPRRQPQPH